MLSYLGDHLSAARHAQFVGRNAELQHFESILVAKKLPFHVMYIHGPGGIGKTTLLHEFALLCQKKHVPMLYLDGRSVEATPQALTEAIQHGLPNILLAHKARHVLLIDTYEMLAPLDDWLRTRFLPQLPLNTLVVLAGRKPPAMPWRLDPGWQTMLATLPLLNLRPDESRTYLARRGVPDDQHLPVLEFTHGHPLALSLVADVFDQRPGSHFQPQAVPDVVQGLLAQFLQKVPGPAHRAVLEVCALVRLTNEALLGDILGLAEVYELFTWLKDLSFIEAQPGGVFPHDLAREALQIDLRWRNPEWYAELHRRARAYYTTRLNQIVGLAQQQTLLDLIYLHRDNPMVRPYFEWEISGNVRTDRMLPGDLKLLQAIVARHEGPQSARIASYWFSRWPQNVLVWRDGQQQPTGFLLMLPLHEVADDSISEDPALPATWRYLQNHAPLRPGEVATLFRFWMAAETYQAVSTIQSLIFVHAVRHYLTTPQLAYTFFTCADPDFWSEVFTYAALERVPSADFTLDGRRYGMYGHDWRRMPPLAWMNILGERETITRPEDFPTHPIEPLVVLNESQFAAAVREALRLLTEPDKLQNNPLLRTRLVLQHVQGNLTAATLIEQLQALIDDAAEQLHQSPRQAKFYLALYHTYLHPAPSQERAAEALDLPFSTFRRHLKSGIDAITETLWQQEIAP